MSEETIPNRRSVRLRCFDYSQSGYYFLTICTQDKKCIFGRIHNGEMILNECGRIARDEWLNTISVRKNIELLEFVVMPNHFHAIVQICRGVLHTPYANEYSPDNFEKFQMGVCNTPLRSPSQTIGSVVRGYKGAVSKQIGGSIWQRNYWEHIIRDEKDYIKHANYIMNNPRTWTRTCCFKNSWMNLTNWQPQRESNPCFQNENLAS